MTQVTVIMSIYNRPRLTKQTIEHMREYAGIPFKLWIVDDGSEQETKDYLASLKPEGYCEEVELVTYTDSVGKAKRLNEFLVKKDYDFCCVLDNDVLLPVDWLKNCVRALVEDEGIGLACVNVEGINPRVILKDYGNSDRLLAYTIGGACMVWGDFVRDNITTFCEDYGRYGHEDAHFTQETRARGKAVIVLKEFGIHLDDRHIVRDSDSEWDKEYKKMKNDWAVSGVDTLRINMYKLDQSLKSSNKD